MTASSGAVGTVSNMPSTTCVVRSAIGPDRPVICAIVRDGRTG